jgi:hypothetical protein
VGTLGTIVLILVVVAILVLAYVYVWNRRPARKAGLGAVGDGAPASGPEPDLNLGTVQQGDILALWDGREPTVERAIVCQETLPGRVTSWKWLFLEGGQLLALAPVGNVLYTDTTVLYQGSEPYERLTGEIENGGVLKTFEARVREGTVGANPVFFEYEGQQFRVQSTGTFSAADQPLPEAEVWSDVQVDEGQNVYFKMVGADATQVLGIWTSHIALLKGRVLAPADVREIYRAGR